MLAEITQLKEIIKLKDREISSTKNLVIQLKEQVELLQRLHFGIKSEKLTSEDKKQATLLMKQKILRLSNRLKLKQKP